MFSPKGMELERGWPGRVEGDRVIQLAAQTLQVFFTAGGALRDHAEYPLAEVDLRAPVLHPPGFRIFGEGLDFVFGNTAVVYGPGDEVPYPAGSSDLRSEPALVAVVGAEGAIGGWTGGNAWHAPDLPGTKSRDFALSDPDTGDVLSYSAGNLPPGLSIDSTTGVISGTLDHSASQGGPYTVTVSADDGNRLLREQPVPGVVLAKIGECVDAGLWLDEGGTRRPLEPTGWVHPM